MARSDCRFKGLAFSRHIFAARKGLLSPATFSPPGTSQGGGCRCPPAAVSLGLTTDARPGVYQTRRYLRAPFKRPAWS
jgi:hypothetical protein